MPGPTPEYNRSNGGLAALNFARKLTGLEYVYGGDGPPGGVDCARLTQWAYEQVGVYLPRDSEDQKNIEPLNNRILNSAPGDLLFIPGDPVDPNPGHVMIYVEPGVVFEALETGTRVGQFPFDTDSWEFRTRPAFSLQPPLPTPPINLPPAEGIPPKSAIKRAGVVLLKDVAQAETALHNGYDLWYWSKTHFVAQVDGEPKPEALYANVHFEQKRG